MGKVEPKILVKNYEELKEKYKEIDLDSLFERKVKYYKLKPFEGRSKAIWIEKIKEWVEFVNEDVTEESLPKKKIHSAFQSYYNKKDLVKAIWETIPYFYDNSKMWWVWDLKDYKWKIVDDKDMLNIVDENSDINTINSKEKSEIIEAMEQYGRKRIPEPIKKHWIQFKDTFFDLDTGKMFLANPKYFATNPIPYKLGESEDTPMMDKIFEEWVGLDYVKTLYEIIAYCLLPDYPISRLFILYGEGANGKSCYEKLIKKFIGKENVTSTELDILLQNHFEITKFHKKLVCIMGEINFTKIERTSILKKLVGGDIIGYEYKHKLPFDDENYAKIIIATNNLPVTTDKTFGFYRRMIIVDFFRRFTEKKDILKDIPEIEYDNLCLKCIKILKELLEKREFHNEGSVEDRKKKYEEKSNPLDKFWGENIDEEPNYEISKFHFRKRLHDWCIANRFRDLSDIDVFDFMESKGIKGHRIQKEWTENNKLIKRLVYCWVGIRFKDEKDWIAEIKPDKIENVKL